MKNPITGIIAFCGLLFTFASCQKDDKVTLKPGDAPQLTASATTATVSSSTGSTNAVTYTWSKADYGYQAGVTYTLQFAKQGTNFASPQDFNLGIALSKSFTQQELNNVYNNIDCNLPSVPAPLTLEVRVKASVSDAVAPLVSSVKTILTSPYQAVIIPSAQWGLVGPAGDGWPGATNTDRLMPYDCRVRAYVLRMPLNAGPFKFRANQDWGSNLGGVTGDYTRGVALTPNGPDLVIATAGTYTVKLEVTAGPTGAATSGKVTVTP